MRPHICEAKYGFLWVSEGDGLRPVAYHGVQPEFVAAYPRDLVCGPSQTFRSRASFAPSNLFMCSTLGKNPDTSGAIRHSFP